MSSIFGKVAKIIDSRTLVVNVGAKQGVELGMVFQIYTSEHNVIDPETNKPLGNIKLPKVKVKVIDVQELFSVAETFEYATVNKGGHGVGSQLNSFSKMFEPPRLVKAYVTFEITDDQRKEISEESSIVKVGDVAEVVTYEEGVEVS